MKHRHLALIAVAACGLAAAQTASAEDAKTAADAAPAPDWTFPSSVSFVSDYIFRGQSQTWGRPAAQVSVEADHKSGFYAGFFGSNVSDQWLPGASVETDLYAGFRGTVPSTEFGFDVGAIYYIYPGGDWKESGFNPPNNDPDGNPYAPGTTKPNKLDTAEAYASLSYKWLSVKTGVTLTDYWGWNTNNSGVGIGFAGNPKAGVTGSTSGSYFFEANATYEVMPSWTVSGQVGRQVISNSTGLDITYYKIGLTKAFDGGWSVGAFYSATNEPNAYKDFLSLRNTVSKSDIAQNKFFVNLSRAF